MSTGFALPTPVRPAAFAAAEAGHDYDLHGLVGIRLVDASPQDIAAVDAQLGPIAAPLEREPDIIVRFVDHLSLSSPLRLVGLEDSGFTDDAFLILRGKHKIPLRVQIPFESIGGRCEIVCERGAPAVPLLIAIINLTVLAKGGLPLHASAVRYQDSGVLITGWSKGGKTETLLALIAAGAEYVGDEWIYLDPEQGRMFGIPEPVRIWDWQMAQLPGYWNRLPYRERLRLRTLRGMASLLAKAAGSDPRSRRGWRRRIHPLRSLLDRQCYVHLPPHHAFGARTGALHERLDTVVFVLSHESPEFSVRPMSPEEIAERMAFSLQEEREVLLSYYRKFRFSHPEKVNPLIEQAADLERERLARALRGRECYALLHPYPPFIPALHTALRPYLDRKAPAA